MSNVQALELARRALGLVTAALSDLIGETEKLGADEWRRLVVSEFDDVEQDARQAAELALGLVNLSMMLTADLAGQTGETPLGVLQRHAQRLNTLLDESD